MYCIALNPASSYTLDSDSFGAERNIPYSKQLVMFPIYVYVYRMSKEMEYIFLLIKWVKMDQF